MQDDVEVLLAEHLAVVVVGAGLLLRGLARGDDLRRAGQHLFVHVAERDHLDRRHLDQPEQVALAVPAAADEADALLLVCEFSGIAAEGRQRQSCRTDLDEFPAVHDSFCRAANAG